MSNAYTCARDEGLDEGLDKRSGDGGVDPGGRCLMGVPVRPSLASKELGTVSKGIACSMLLGSRLSMQVAAKPSTVYTVIHEYKTGVHGDGSLSPGIVQDKNWFLVACEYASCDPQLLAHSRGGVSQSVWRILG